LELVIFLEIRVVLNYQGKIAGFFVKTMDGKAAKKRR